MSIASPVRLPSERHFGLMSAGAWAVAGVFGFIRHWSVIAAGVCFTVAIIFGLLAYATPEVLVPLNKAWFRLGELLGRVVTPLVLGVIFFCILTPISILTRLFGRDQLRLKPRAVTSYWRHRAPPESVVHSFRNQF